MQVSGAVKARHKGLDATAWFSKTRTISSIERPVVVAIASMAGSISRGRSNKYEPLGVMGPLLRGERRDLLGRPDVIGHPGFHRGRHAERLVDAREVVPHRVERDGRLVVVQLPAGPRRFVFLGEGPSGGAWPSVREALGQRL